MAGIIQSAMTKPRRPMRLPMLEPAGGDVPVPKPAAPAPAGAMLAGQVNNMADAMNAARAATPAAPAAPAAVGDAAVGGAAPGGAPADFNAMRRALEEANASAGGGGGGKPPVVGGPGRDGGSGTVDTGIIATTMNKPGGGGVHFTGQAPVAQKAAGETTQPPDFVVEQPPPTGGPQPAPEQPGPRGVTPSSIPYDKPTTREVTDQETVRGQLDTLLSENSPLLRRARARAMERAAASGLRNSTMAAQAGEAAVLDAAMPIATADAGTYSRQALVNQDAVNNYINTGRQLEAQLSIATMDDRRVRELARAEDARIRELAADELRSRETLTREELRVRGEIALTQLAAAQADSAARMRLGEMELESANRRFDTEMGFRRDESTRQQSNFDAEMGYRRDTSTIDANFRQNQLDQQTRDNYANRISDIMSNPNLSTEERDAAVRNINTIYGRTGGTPPGSGSNLFGRPAGSGTPAGSVGRRAGNG